MRWLNDRALRAKTLDKFFNPEFKAATLVAGKMPDRERWREALAPWAKQPRQRSSMPSLGRVGSILENKVV